MGAAVAASELVRHVLNISNVTEPMANTLLAPLLSSDARFIQTDDGCWLAKPESERAENDWVLCKVFPASADWRRIAALCCALVQDGVIVEKKCFRENLYQNDVGRQISEYVLNGPLVFDGIKSQVTAFRRYMLNIAGATVKHPLVLLKSIVLRFYPETECRSEADIARALGQSEFADATMELCFDSFCRQAEKAFELLHGRGVHGLAELQNFVAAAKETPDFDSYNFDASFVESVPQAPGVYLMKNKTGKVIYVGKAKSLRRRLKSYFGAAEELDEKTRQIRNEIFDISIIQTGSELEALFLENDLIKGYHPKINSQTDVHDRGFLQSRRFAQIVLLPATDENKVALLLFNPARAVKFITVNKENNEALLKKELKAAFFNRKFDADRPDMEEIATSWLSTNHLTVSRVDMRFVVTLEEALRLLKAQIKEFQAGTNVVCI